MSLFDDAEFPAPTNATWVAPTGFPDLSGARRLAIDTETYDPELLDKGPGWGRKQGHIVGISVATDDAAFYFPMRHANDKSNLPPLAVLGWANDTFNDPKQNKIFTSAQYDLGWLQEEGVSVSGAIQDVQIAEPLLDEHAHSYSLDALGKKYLGEQKKGETLYDWCARAYGGKADKTQRANIWRAPASLVGPYAIGDVDLPLRIFDRQHPLLEEQGLLPLFEIESRLPQLLMRMRMRGVRVDLARAELVRSQLLSRVRDIIERIRTLTGVAVEIWTAESIARAFDAAGIDYPKTRTGKPSFTAEWLEHHDSELANLIRQARKYDKACATFIDGYIFDKVANGRVHGLFHQLRGEDGGTIVGRFSSSLPNLENIPARDEEIGPMIRGLYLPEEGERWTVLDMSQIQFRIMTHYAVGRGADAARAMYNRDPNTDYHNMAQALIEEQTGIHLERKPVKNINFGLAFTMGVDKLADSIGISIAEAKPLIKAYHDGLAFVRATQDMIDNVGQSRGYIKGILGRRHRFDQYEARDYDLKKLIARDSNPVVVQKAILEYIDQLRAEGNTKNFATGVARAFTHLGLNRLAQDGEGSHMKKALVECDAAGIFDVIGPPLNIVHDDVNFSTNGSKAHEEALAEATHIFETAITWKVPMIAKRTEGNNWGEAK